MRWLSAVGIVALLGVLAAQLVAPDLLQRASLALAITGILIGVPHGAVDHMVPLWTGRAAPGVRAMVPVLMQYLAVAAVAAAAIAVVPHVAVVVFLVASAVHFGQAETQFHLVGSSTSLGRTGALHSCAHGATVIVVPLALWHEQVAAVLGRLTPALAGSGVTSALLVGAIVVLSLDAVLAVRAWHSGQLLQACEIVLVALVFVVVSPLAAFAVYFGCWHALRHTGRLLQLPARDGSALPLSSAVRRYAVHAAGPTLAVVLVLIVLWSHRSHSVLTVALAVLLALTFPHMRTVAGLDRWAARQDRDDRARFAQ